MVKKILLVSLLFLAPLFRTNAQEPARDMFAPISKYMQAGDYESLSAWFADNLELEILGSVNNCTRNQAKLIMKNFFTKYTPKKFTIIHKSGKAPMKYAVGSLSAGGEEFRVILFVKSTSESSYIEQIKITRN